jgi:hypothetical protein
MRILILLLLITACGKDVKFTNELEKSTSVSQAQPLAITQTATIIRSSATPPGTIIMNGKSYKISPFSSYVALTFINQLNDGVQTPVKIRGEVRGNEVYLKIIE